MATVSRLPGSGADKIDVRSIAVGRIHGPGDSNLLTVQKRLRLGQAVGTVVQVEAHQPVGFCLCSGHAVCSIPVYQLCHQGRLDENEAILDEDALSFRRPFQGRCPVWRVG